jgi:hypothetical protein
MSRPTTLVESDQLAQATVAILRSEDFVPKNKRWLLPRVSKPQKDYEKAVLEIAVRRRTARERAIEAQFKQQRAEVDTTFEQAKTRALREYDEKIAEAKKPFDEAEAAARSERDAAIAAATLAYHQKIDSANHLYKQKSAILDDKREALVGTAKNAQAEAYAAIEAKRKAALAQLAHDLRTIVLEGPMRVVEDRHAWTVDERRKALIGLVDMAGREDFDAEFVDVCLRNVAGYVSQDRFLPADGQHQRLMDASVLEALVDLARRTPERRPMIVHYIHDIVAHNPGHSSPAFIKSLSELYVMASGDTESVYAKDPAANDAIFDRMREQIADALKLTPRRSQVPPRTGDVGPNTHADDTTPASDTEITAEVDVRELVPLERDSALGTEAEAVVREPPPPARQTSPQPPPMPAPRRGKRAPVPEGTN